MNKILNRRWLLVLLAAVLASCGGGGPSSSPPPLPGPTLASIALSPLQVAVGSGGTMQLTVTGTYSDGSTAILPASHEIFQSSNTDIATVNANGLATVVTNASAGATATIGATDTASDLITSQVDSTFVTVTAGDVGPPTPNSAQAASATAQNNALCTAIEPFYWEIGNASGPLASGSPTPPSGTAVTASKIFATASASKWIYAMYVVQKRGGAANLTAADIPFMNLTSGYTNMGSITQAATCTPPPSGADSINYCLTLSSPSGPYVGQDPNTIGKFAYDSGHEENHAGQFQPEINALDASGLGPAIVTGLGVKGITLAYRQPLLAGGIYANANDYSALLRAVLSGQLYMLGALGTHAVCAWVGPDCNAARSPQQVEKWHYSIGHWVEDDASLGDDGAFSSPGAFGFDPWIEANKKYYGVISRMAPAGSGNQQGFASALCARQLRAAWETGVQQ
ncbi:MAG: Ig-like domain-containing protein [Acidimicrobiales bacterium]